MDIPATPRSPSAGNGLIGGPSAPNGTGTGTALNSDFQTFLEMLTVQMQNQDPLNPADPTEFATQLATFSSVEQQVRTNELLVALGAQMGALGVSQLSQWIGMQASAEMPVLFEGSPVTVETPGNTLADNAELVVTDRSGKEVQRMPVGTEAEELQWAGTLDTGAPLPAGEYNLAVEYSAEGETLATDPVYVQARIMEARNEDGVPILIMDSGQKVESSAIVGLRAAAD
ncbi:flagellar hook capping FlgD N-terminal domain-containing protein [Roseovarius salis]|uniref:flagellar hook capping FlgD N-terminal domain-containing protein n=1 Tax=Roseovarius salis TaxID=3376063 RepID=UPI0037C77FD9